MPFQKSEFIWMNGEFVRWEDARVHVMSHVIHYGSALFEGIRCYKTAKGPAVFRLKEHTRRLFDSCHIYRIEIPYSQDAFSEAIVETVRKNGMESCYIRPIVYRGYGDIGVNPFPCPVECTIAVIGWGRYLGPEALEQGVDVKVSTWGRMAANTFPALAKASANYMNSQLIKMEAVLEGYVEGIALDTQGFVSEGSGENIFVVRDGRITTPPLGASILPGITRASVIQIARDLGMSVEEQRVPREALYIADEVFFTGTAAEISPIRSVDKIKVGAGKRGPVTEAIQKEYFGIIEGEKPDKYNWLTPV